MRAEGRNGKNGTDGNSQRSTLNLGDGPADLLKTGEIPEIREIPALLRLDRLDRAIVSRQKYAAAVWLLLQGQALAIMTQPGETLDEIIFTQTMEGGKPRDFRVRQTHLPWPAAAGGTSLAFEKNRHGIGKRRFQPARQTKPLVSAAGTVH